MVRGCKTKEEVLEILDIGSFENSIITTPDNIDGSTPITVTDLFNKIFEMIGNNGNLIFSVSEIANRLGNGWDKKGKSLETWIGQNLNQFNMYEKKSGNRKNGKRAYIFSYNHFSNIFNEFKKGKDHLPPQIVDGKY